MNDDDNKDPFLKEKDEVDADLIEGEVDVLDEDILDEDIVEPEDEDDETPLWEEEE